MNRLTSTIHIALFMLLALTTGCTETTPPVAMTESSRPAAHPEIEFFQSISGELEVELTAPTENIGDLANQRAPADATIKSLRLVPEIFEEQTMSARPLTAEELQRVAYHGSNIRLRGESQQVTTHAAPNGKHFTVQELLNAVEESERQSRGNSEWFGGVDVHHVFFEGLELADDGVWDIIWGS
jgi:hypothetical protein